MKRKRLREIARRYPAELLGVLICALVGGILSLLFMPEDLGAVSRGLGGALLGGLAWLVPNFGRLLGGDR